MCTGDTTYGLKRSQQAGNMMINIYEIESPYIPSLFDHLHRQLRRSLWVGHNQRRLVIHLLVSQSQSSVIAVVSDDDMWHKMVNVQPRCQVRRFAKRHDSVVEQNRHKEPIEYYSDLEKNDLVLFVGASIDITHEDQSVFFCHFKKNA